MKYTKQYAPEIQQALKKYNWEIEAALCAAQKLEAIAISTRLAKLFWSDESQTAQALKQDYLVSA